jgi:hypothetical protein
MKKILLILVIAAAAGFGGCDSIFNSHRVTIVNEDSDKYITSVYYRNSSYSNEKWSKNQIYSDIEPGNSYQISLGNGTYDFRVFMEDSYYSYTLYARGVRVDYDLSLPFCYECLNERDKAAVERVPKTQKKTD